MLSASLLVEKGNCFQGKTSGSEPFPSRHYPPNAPLMSSPSPKQLPGTLKHHKNLKHPQDLLQIWPLNFGDLLLLTTFNSSFFLFFFLYFSSLRGAFPHFPKLKVGGVHVMLGMQSCSAALPQPPVTRLQRYCQVKRLDRALQTKITSAI